jgi:hypothetical protein
VGERLDRLWERFDRGAHPLMPVDLHEANS